MKKRDGLLLLMLGGLISGGIAIGATMIKSMSHEIDRYRNFSEKHLSLFLLMNQWVKVKQEGKSLLSYLDKNGYNKIAIYGMSYVGQTLLNELRAEGIQVSYAIDKQADGIYTDIDIISPEDCLEEVDVIVVTAITFYEDIKGILSQKMSCPIISLEDILYEI